MYKVLFLPHNKTVEVKDGENLIRAAMEAGVHINASCGGEGVCGKCRVRIEEGQIEGGLSEKLDEKDIKQGYRLACLSHVKSDLIIRIPVESQIDTSSLNLKTAPRQKARIEEVSFEDLKTDDGFDLPVKKILSEIPRPEASDNVPDIPRLFNDLKHNHNEDFLDIDLPVMREIPNVIREKNFVVTTTIAQAIGEHSKDLIINVQAGDTSDKNFALAVDIGTTTVHGHLIDLLTGETLGEHVDYNRQISFGEDVISRIMFGEKPEGLEKLQKAVVESINRIINRLIKKTKIAIKEISAITIAGNTTMIQLLLAINPAYIRRSPYVPAATHYPPFNAVDIGIKVDPHVIVLTYPGVSSYVGGDIVAGIIGSGLYKSEKVSLYMDIGTNAEIVIGNREWMVCAACSAGPAFEGGGIKFGMRAAKGAIEDFAINPLTLEPMNLTIGDVRPKGICGSGLITIVAELFEAGVIDNGGEFARDTGNKRIRQSDGIYEYVLAWADETQIGRNLTLTEPDIDNLIRAKGAIYSGCLTLLKEVGLTINDLDQIIIAGAFGSYMDVEKAMTIGLLPETDSGKISFIGNGSLVGAKMSALSNQIRKDVRDVLRRITNFELSETTSFMDNYVAALFLPHTDMGPFPKLKARLDRNRKNSSKETT
ncbi:MAG: ASKHA domain-containing protein [Desulfobacterales bacterium]|nr:ASKHA domain-containing protein [Desulfobacterales bacterium]